MGGWKKDYRRFIFGVLPLAAVLFAPVAAAVPYTFDIEADLTAPGAQTGWSLSGQFVIPEDVFEGAGGSGSFSTEGDQDNRIDSFFMQVTATGGSGQWSFDVGSGAEGTGIALCEAGACDNIASFLKLGGGWLPMLTFQEGGLAQYFDENGGKYTGAYTVTANRSLASVPAPSPLSVLIMALAIWVVFRVLRGAAGCGVRTPSEAPHPHGRSW